MADDVEGLFVAALPGIDRMLDQIGRRYHCRAEDAEDLAAEARLFLMKDDYAVLRKFEGRSQLSTYLHVVLERFASGYFNRSWGRWRASTAALASGELAVRIERLLFRDGLAEDDAFERVREWQGATFKRQDFDALRARIPRRPPRVRAAESLDAVPVEMAVAAGGDELVRDRERQELIERVHAAFREGLQALTSEDRMMLRLAYIEGLPMQGVARVLQTTERHLRKRMEKVRPRMRRALAATGLGREQLGDVVGTALWEDSGALTVIDVPPSAERNAAPQTPAPSVGTKESRWSHLS